MKKYKHFISLGYFCSIALELERMGLRSCSSPFDWCISDWEGVEKAISSHFENFLCYDNLYQDKRERMHYKDVGYGIVFFHDFNKYSMLKEQLGAIQEKYERRIEQFYKDISEPTLFIRYISDEQGRKEIDYIEKNYDKILGLLRSFNNDNDIIFIANSKIKSNIIKLYSVEKDENDVVARWPLDKNKDLHFLLDNFEYSEKKKNYDIYLKKKKKESSKWYKIRKKSRNMLKKMLCNEYIHDKQY